jgi:hypothetical protein
MSVINKVNELNEKLNQIYYYYSNMYFSCNNIICFVPLTETIDDAGSFEEFLKIKKETDLYIEGRQSISNDYKSQIFIHGRNPGIIIPSSDKDVLQAFVYTLTGFDTHGTRQQLSGSIEDNLDFVTNILNIKLKQIKYFVTGPNRVIQTLFYISGYQIEEAIFNTRMEIYNLTHRGDNIQDLRREIEELKKNCCEKLESKIDKVKINLSRVEGMVREVEPEKPVIMPIVRGPQFSRKFNNNNKNNKTLPISRAHVSRFINGTTPTSRPKPRPLKINSPRRLSRRYSQSFSVENL